MSLAALPMLAVLGVLPGLLLKFLSRGLGHWRWVDARCSATPGLPSLPTTTSKTKTASTVLRDSPTPVPLNSFAFKTGGCGLSGSGTRDLWDLFCEWESDCPPEPAAPRRLRDYFPTPHDIQQALSDDIDAAVEREEWFSCRMTALEEDFE
ncbi:hypothetical protein I4F81_010411 [Pyropia yezoensis]|uniref:Uncharacterized protein n=1 Tax=Pyropia yezoensis TaxID=2788 RepID=A0ACC3CCN4_PYRYE|nr:hypothetical protein I4F81_010411 [Neopyropia yezoensis]